MFIAITSEKPSLDARIDQRFGRCRYFLIVNTDDLSYEAISNQNASLGGGAGIQSARMIAAKGVSHVLTGACGPNAYQVLAAAGTNVITGCSGAVRDAIGQFREGSFTTANGPNVADHYGAGQNFSGQTGPGMNAMGGGMGRGMGGGMGGGFAGQRPPFTQNTQAGSDDELEMLKRQMDRIGERINQLEKEKSGKR